ncbi:hypothetical protein EP837_00273 [Sphingobium sp. EP60837]|uniref:Uncharacterized protein n=1 Tax=Sphingobium tyrosinilyticum TaxID=2715436 RepID=A0ABV9EXQ1_9SPHN|nr:hypothetical protein EP837_00273 [Sphingobium sp. EP60837]
MICFAFRSSCFRPLAVCLMLIFLFEANAGSAQSIILPEGLTITLETRQDVSSKSTKEGQSIDLAVTKPVVIGGVTVIAAGTPVIGEVMRASDNGLLGRSGKLNIRVSRVRAGQQDVAVRGERNVEGKSGTLNSVGAGIVFLPLAILVRGKDVPLPAGTTFDVYVDKEIAIATTGPASMNMGANPSPPPPESNVIRAIDPNEALTP